MALSIVHIIINRLNRSINKLAHSINYSLNCCSVCVLTYSYQPLVLTVRINAFYKHNLNGTPLYVEHNMFEFESLAKTALGKRSCIGKSYINYVKESLLTHL